MRKTIYYVKTFELRCYEKEKVIILKETRSSEAKERRADHSWSDTL